MEELLTCAQPALIAATDRLLDLVAQVIDRHCDKGDRYSLHTVETLSVLPSLVTMSGDHNELQFQPAVVAMSSVDERSKARRAGLG